MRNASDEVISGNHRSVIVDRIVGIVRAFPFLKRRYDAFALIVLAQGLTRAQQSGIIELRHLPPSSRGPGRGPFKAKTGVRIPVGALNKPGSGPAETLLVFACLLFFEGS